MLKRKDIIMTQELNRRYQFIINTLYFALFGLLIYLALKYVAGWIMPFLVAFLIVSMVHPVIRRIKKALKIERPIISLIIMVLVYVLVFSLLFGLIWLAVLGIKSLVVMLPSYYEETLYPAIVRINQSISSFFQDLPTEWQAEIRGFQLEFIKSVQSLLFSISQKGIAAISNFTGKIPSFLIGFLFTIMLSFFISFQYDAVLAVLRRALPKKAVEMTVKLKRAVLDTILRYLRAAITLMLITATELSIGLFVIGYKNFFTIALIISLFDALPLLGTGTVMIPWALLELIQGNYPFALGLGIVYAIVAVVRNIIEPKIISDKLGLNPIISLSAMYLGFQLFGVLGMIGMPILAQITMALHKDGSIPFLQRFTNPSHPAADTPPSES